MSSENELWAIPMGSGEHLLLGSPDVGLFTGALKKGTWICAGQTVGYLTRLGRTTPLKVPADFAGPAHGRAQIVSATPDPVLLPVGFRTRIYELELGRESEGSGPASSSNAAESDSPALVVPAPQSGRFYHRPGPDSPPFLSPGTELTEGTALGLIEVMKTFAHVSYHAGSGLPERARMTAWVVEDGAEVREGDPLLEFEPI